MKLVVRHGNLSMYQVLSSTVFSFVSYMHIHMPLRMYWPRLFFVVFQEKQCLSIFNHDDVRHVTELYLSTKFHVCHCCG